MYHAGTSLEFMRAALTSYSAACASMAFRWICLLTVLESFPIRFVLDGLDLPRFFPASVARLLRRALNLRRIISIFIYIEG